MLQTIQNIAGSITESFGIGYLEKTGRNTCLIILYITTLAYLLTIKQTV
jgi:hypothetical protein